MKIETALQVASKARLHPTPSGTTAVGFCPGTRLLAPVSPWAAVAVWLQRLSMTCFASGRDLAALQSGNWLKSIRRPI